MKKEKAPKPPKVKSDKPKNNKAWKRFKRRLSLFILLAFCGTVFYLGTIQRFIPEGQGILFYSKYPGYEDRILYPGEFHWRWQAVIPEFSAVYPFPSTVQHREIEREGQLPSAELFQDHFSLEEDFSYTLLYTVSYKIDEDHWISQVGNGTIDPLDNDAHFQMIDERIAMELLTLLEEQSHMTYPWEESDQLLEDLNRSIPQADVLTLEPGRQRLPDLEMYEQLRRQYFAYLDEVNSARIEAAQARAGEEWVTREKLEILQEYGELITQYPLLLDFFALDQENGLDRVRSTDLLPTQR